METREADLRAFIERRMNYYIEQVGGGHDRSSARVEKTFAMAYVAGLLAQRCGIIRKEWGPLLPAIREIHRSILSGSPPKVRQSALERVGTYARSHRAYLIEVASLRRPLSPNEFEAATGFVRQAGGDREILIPSARFQREFSDFRPMMQELRDAGLAKTEGGEHPKLTIKAPSSICHSGRVYCIRLGDHASRRSEVE
jgi:hypothetical protein